VTTHPALSLWADTLPAAERVEGSPLDGDLDVDVAIVGAGYTGLWTAWYLRRHDPGLRVAVIERDHVGFGASGRNGGWCSALLPMSLPAIAHRHGDAAARRMQVAMHETVDEVGRFVAERADPAIFHRGGTIDVARSRPQQDRLREEVEVHHQFGFTDDDYRWLDAAEATAVMNATAVSGAFFTPHCATVHPMRLAHAVARAATDAGALLYEQTAVTDITAGLLHTERGRVRAEMIVRATEGYTGDLPGERRTMIPFYSSIVATEPLTAETWARIGLQDRPTFADGRRMVIYGQRTADDRLAFGGRGSAYPFASSINRRAEMNDDIRARLVEILRGLFPVLDEVSITHSWGGVLGVTRDWTCSVRLDRAAGFATAGGYVGDGVSTTNLAGRTLAALITESTDDHDRELAGLPWVGHRSRRWEPEPLRWLGVNGGRLLAARADAAEERSGRLAGVWGRALDRLIRR
jgi:glycine/D-amino acid oxidase-like deaminating enzyme